MTEIPNKFIRLLYFADGGIKPGLFVRRRDSRRVHVRPMAHRLARAIDRLDPLPSGKNGPNPDGPGPLPSCQVLESGQGIDAGTSKNTRYFDTFIG